MLDNVKGNDGKRGVYGRVRGKKEATNDRIKSVLRRELWAALDGYDACSKRRRMMESNPYYFSGIGVASSFYQPYTSCFSGGTYDFPAVRLRGLPFNCDDLDVYEFFAGLDIVDCLLVNKNGRFSGEAFVVFPSLMQAEFALQRDRQNMGRRYIEVFYCRKQDYYNAVAAEVNCGRSFDDKYHQSSPPAHPKGSFEVKYQMEFTEVLELRGLPYSATQADIVDFFAEFELTEDKVHIACHPDGKPTGEAYVDFPSAEVAEKAMCKKDKGMIGSRYVELFPATLDEARRAKSRFRH